jgi:hypothetical protein
MRTSKRQFAAKVETTPGTAETITSSEVLVRIRDGDTIEPNFEAIDSQEVQATSSKRPNLIGRRTLGFKVSYLLRGPGGLSTDPAAKPLLEASMLKGYDLQKISIGAITTGPFVDGETITGGTSAATGRVFRNTANGASEIKYFALTNTFQSGEVITGGTSTATATTSSTPSANGMVFQPADSDFGVSDSKHHVTAKLLQDGYQWTARGCLADLTMQFRNGHPCTISQSFLGAYSSSGDEALLTLATYPEESVAAPRFLNASLKFGVYSPSDVVDFSLEYPISPEAREDANDSAGDGVRFADYQREHPRLRLDPAMVSAATYNYFSTMFAGTTFAMEWVLGSTSGSTWTFYADTAQFVNLGAGARRNLATVPLEIILCGTNNNELYIWQH